VQAPEPGLGVGEFVLRPDQRGMVGHCDRLRALDDRDVLGHAQPRPLFLGRWSSPVTAVFVAPR
jgi:hypothetical protein